MERRFAWVLGFAFGLSGGVALATGSYTAATAVGGESQYVDAGSGSIVEAAQPGKWIVSGTGGRILITEGAAAPAKGSASDTTGVAVPFNGSEFEKLMLETWCQEQQISCDEEP